jgi:hypothetical protein
MQQVRADGRMQWRRADSSAVTAVITPPNAQHGSWQQGSRQENMDRTPLCGEFLEGYDSGDKVWRSTGAEALHVGM